MTIVGHIVRWLKYSLAFYPKWLNDRIAQVGAELPVDGADQVLDLQGLSLAPGFIDAHSHNDWFALRSDPLPWFDPFIRQGITTFVTGNCGISTVGFDKLGVSGFLQAHARFTSCDAIFPAVAFSAVNYSTGVYGRCQVKITLIVIFCY